MQPFRPAKVLQKANRLVLDDPTQQGDRNIPAHANDKSGWSSTCSGTAMEQCKLSHYETN